MASKTTTTEAKARWRIAGASLKRLREDAELTQRDLSMKVGFDYYTMVSQIETGAVRLPAEKWEA